ncbi:thiamine phosphate synthase [Pedobacter punctiformis]|uniref:Thiamine phosphate synthase n=1 Tax=Pedobacter punctiformis TaxID=3004097 RepID=A0ABT4L7R4_9SPHI|nr:thiamine phosphate synthase [Pedobacter sp. HCMS5-2]MCZ4243958.1 thiamine phosphate synthase [Pedobacter sp. HCMS5-2]
MLIVISSPVQIEEEAQYINGLFDAGLPLFHLRKPDYDEAGVEALLKKINQEHYPKIALHQQHQLANEFGIKRLHFTERLRKETDVALLDQYVNEGFILSTSIHEPEAYCSLGNPFSYCFIGPVFNSISKKNYPAKSELRLPRKSNTHLNLQTDLIALGGIDKHKVLEIKKLDFDGLAVLGAIWSNPVQSRIKFKEIQDLWI